MIIQRCKDLRTLVLNTLLSLQWQQRITTVIPETLLINSFTVFTEHTLLLRKNSNCYYNQIRWKWRKICKTFLEEGRLKKNISLFYSKQTCTPNLNKVHTFARGGSWPQSKTSKALQETGSSQEPHWGNTGNIRGQSINLHNKYKTSE